jgi:chemotaxis methyl-accepting protein methylase
MTLALAELARVIQRESGIVLKPAQLPSLQDAISRVDRNLSAESLLGPRASAQTMARLIDEITVRETFFFRQRSELDAIDWHSLLAAARARGSERVRIWVAACASGEEAYTVAILACEAFASALPPVSVLATDIAAAALAHASAGRYRTRATRTLDDEIRGRYFVAESGEMCVGERLRRLVEFRKHNLVRDPMPGTALFDVVLCRNVLIYFDRPTVERVVSSLERSLTPTGLLVLGAADRLSGTRHNVAQRQPKRAARRAQSRTQPVRQVRGRGTGGRTDAPHPRRAKPRTVARAPARSAPSRDGSDATPPGGPTIAEALKAADRGDIDLAMSIARQLLAEDPLDPQAHYILGAGELARDNGQAALEPLRRALYSDPNFTLAAFKLARAHDLLGEAEPARRAYLRTLRTLDHGAREQLAQAERVDLLDVASACRARLRSLGDAR